MWKEVFGGDEVERRHTECYAGEENSLPSRRVSAASDDSFDASCYVHVDNKLKSKMPKCLLNDETKDLEDIQNHFAKLSTANNNNNAKVTKSGKRVIRKRLSALQASRLREKNGDKNCNNNSNIASDRANNNDTSSSSDSDTMQKQSATTKQERKTKDVLSAKIQHLLFEMKRLRQLDREILRKFLVINDTIEEQKWLVEEKQEAIRRSLSEEGEDLESLSLDIELEPEVQEEVEDDEESIQSVLSRQNSGCEIFDDTLPIDCLETGSGTKTEPEVQKKTAGSDFNSTSSDSALSLSCASSTLSSTTSFPASNRSSSPPTSHLSGSSPTSSFVSSHDRKSENSEKKCTAQARNDYQYEKDIPEDIEGYYRMYGASVKRGSYPFPRRTNTYDGSNSMPTAYHNHTYDDMSINNSFDRRNAYNNMQRQVAPEYQYAARRSLSSRSYNGSYTQQPIHEVSTRPRSASAATTDVEDFRNRVKRISVRPDGTHESAMSFNGLQRPYSANDKNSAAYRLLQHPLHQKRMRMNITRQPPNWSFVPIAEQEPDVMCENGRLFSEDSDPGTGRRNYENVMDDMRQNGRWNAGDYRLPNSRQCPAPRRKPSAIGSAGSLTSSSSRTSSSSLTSSGSNSSLHSPTKFLTNEPDHRGTQTAPVWVQRRRHSTQDNDYIAIPYNQSFPAPFSVNNYHNMHRKGVHNLPEVEHTNSIPSQKSRPVPAPRTSLSLNRSTTYEPHSDSNHVLTVSYKPDNTGANEAVYKWIQTQDDVTYL